MEEEKVTTTTTTEQTTTTPPTATDTVVVHDSPPNNMMPLVAGLLLVLIGLGAYFVYSQQNRTLEQPVALTEENNTTNTMMLREDETDSAIMPQTTTTPSDGSAIQETSVSPTGNESTENRKTITMAARDFAYSVQEIRAKQGDVLTINLTSEEGMHDIVIDELNVKSKQLAAGESEAVVITLNKTGTFEYYCSVGNHREMGMVGKLIVE